MAAASDTTPELTLEEAEAVAQDTPYGEYVEEVHDLDGGWAFILDPLESAGIAYLLVRRNHAGAIEMLAMDADDRELFPVF